MLTHPREKIEHVLDRGEILAFGRFGNARVEGLNAQRRPDRFRNGGFEGANDVGDLLGNGRKQRVASPLDRMIACHDIVPT